MCGDATVLTDVSHMNQFSELKYVNFVCFLITNCVIRFVKKIVQKDRNSKRKDSKNSKRLIKTKSFNGERRKILILKRKEFGFFEKYEHIPGFVNKLRLMLVGCSTKKNKDNI